MKRLLPVVVLMFGFATGLLGASMTRPMDVEAEVVEKRPDEQGLPPPLGEYAPPIADVRHYSVGVPEEKYP